MERLCICAGVTGWRYLLSESQSNYEQQPFVIMYLLLTAREIIPIAQHSNLRACFVTVGYISKYICVELT